MVLLQEALHESHDDGIPGTSLAITSHRAAKEPLQWVATESNTIRAECLTASLIELLNRAFQQTVPTHSSRKREDASLSPTELALEEAVQGTSDPHTVITITAVL